MQTPMPPRELHPLTTSFSAHDLDRAHRLASRVQGREESIDEFLACQQIKKNDFTLSQRT